MFTFINLFVFPEHQKMFDEFGLELPWAMSALMESGYFDGESYGFYFRSCCLFSPFPSFESGQFSGYWSRWSPANWMRKVIGGQAQKMQTAIWSRRHGATVPQHADVVSKSQTAVLNSVSDSNIAVVVAGEHARQRSVSKRKNYHANSDDPIGARAHSDWASCFVDSNWRLPRTAGDHQWTHGRTGMNRKRLTCRSPRKKRSPRHGVSKVEMLVAASLLVTVMSFSVSGFQRINGIWKDIRDRRLAVCELSNQLEELTRLSPDELDAALPELKSSKPCAASLKQAKLSAAQVEDTLGPRIDLTLTWRPRQAGFAEDNVRTVTLSGWLSQSDQEASQ